MCEDDQKQSKAGLKPVGDDNLKDFVVGKEKTDPNKSLEADDIISANNFLGDL